MNFRRQTVKKGNHGTRFIQRYWWLYPNQDHQCQMLIGESFPYEFHKPNGDIDNSKQKDWNKLEGIALNWINPHDRTLMIGGRWNPSEKVAELNFYYHGITDGELDYKKIGNGAVFTKEFVRTELDKRLLVIRSFQGNDIIRQVLKIEDKVLFKDKVKIPYKSGGKHRRINNWFGGQARAQNTYSVFKSYQ